MIRYTIKLRMGARLSLLLLFLMAIGLVGIYGIERANAGRNVSIAKTYRRSASGAIG